MRQLFYEIARRGAMMRTIYILVVMVAIAVALGVPAIALAGPDGVGP